MRRRDFIAWLGSAAASPFRARAQQQERAQTLPVLGYLTNANADPVRLADFRSALAELGYVDGKSISIDVGGAKSNSD
jgi:putative ABC transport system substrate-binding protein